jgi:hypothetical protein
MPKIYAVRDVTLSLYILDLFFNPVYSAFYVDYAIGNLGIGSLAGDGIGFSEHFLTDEVQPAPGLVICLTAIQELLQVRIQPSYLL